MRSPYSTLFLIAALAAGFNTPALAQQNKTDAQQDANKTQPTSKTSQAKSSLIRLSGTRVSIAPPAGFAKADNFSGFISKEKSASLMITELPAPLSKVSGGFSKEPMKERGMDLISSKSKSHGDLLGMEISFTQQFMGMTMIKYAHLFGDEKCCVLATATMVKGEDEAIMDTLKGSIDSIVFDTKAKTPAKDEGLPYTLTETANLKLAERIQNTILYNKAGKLIPPQPGKDGAPAPPRDPAFIVSQSVSKMKIENTEDFARRRIKDTPYLKDLQIEEEKDVETAGLKGRQLKATGVDINSGEKTYLYMQILFQPDGYFIMQGIAPLSTRADSEKDFEAMATSFKLR